MVTLGEVVTGLGFVLAVDNCARGCLHCPAYGSRSPVQRAPLNRLARTLADVAATRTRLGLPDLQQVVHCWRISDPLDYAVRLRSGTVATCAEVAALWRGHLRQGLYVVTNGSEGRPLARRALATVATRPDLVSQVKLTITPADRDWGSDRYEQDLASDIATLAPLWRLRSTRWEDPSGRRLRLNVKATDDRVDEAIAAVTRVLRLAGQNARQAARTRNHPDKVRIKPIFDLGNALNLPNPVAGALTITTPAGDRHKPTPHVRPHLQYGIRPDGRLFLVDMYAFTETDLAGPDGAPLRWPAGQAATVDLSTPLGQR